MNHEYFVKLDQFEGPLDLLLHLIRVHEIDIFDIDVFLLTTEYMAYLRVLKFDDLADAGAFIEMAASLIEIKSRMLLPQDEAGADGEMAEDDPRRSLQQRLIEYDMFKRIADHFGALPQLGVEILTSHEYDRLAPYYADIEAPLTGDNAGLVMLYEQMIREFAERKPLRVEAKTHMVSVEQTIEKMEKYLDTVRYALFQGFYHEFTSRYELVVHILALLELSKAHKVKVYQEEMMGPLWVYRADMDESALPIPALATPVEMIPSQEVSGG